MNQELNTQFADDRLWTPADVASYLQASRSWVYQKAEAGILPGLRIGGLLRFEPEAVRAFVRGDRQHKVVDFKPRSSR
ncbi:MAG: helix-turn-helix domain-containing protein [Myxococcota bacterium]